MGKSEATLRAYRTDWAIFGTWCDRRRLEALPATPATVIEFVESQREAGLAVPTLRRRLAAIRARHQERGYGNPTDDPEVRAALAPGKRPGDERAPARKEALLPDRLAALLGAVPADTLEGVRDRALIMLGFAGAFRRSDLVAIRVDQLEWQREGVLVGVAGRRVPIVKGRVLCPVAALRAWLDASGIDAGPVFRSFTPRGDLRPGAMRPEMVARKLKRYARAAGFPPADVARLAAHSLRSGFVTAALANGADVFRVMEVSGHISAQTVRDYVRSAKPFFDHAGDGLL